MREKEAELLYLRQKVRPEQTAVAEAEVRRAEAAVAEADQRVADTRLTAPFDGTVLKCLRREGEGVSPLVPPEPVVLFGDPPSAVCDWAETSDCDLLVAAAHREGFVRAILGHFTTHLVRHAPCPVLVVRGRTAS